jgi:hypothetical protein
MVLVFIVSEYLSSLYASHHDMVEGTWSVYSGSAGHVGKLSKIERRVQVVISWTSPYPWLDWIPNPALEAAITKAALGKV